MQLQHFPPHGHPVRWLTGPGPRSRLATNFSAASRRHTRIEEATNGEFDGFAAAGPGRRDLPASSAGPCAGGDDAQELSATARAVCCPASSSLPCTKRAATVSRPSPTSAGALPALRAHRHLPDPTGAARLCAARAHGHPAAGRPAGRRQPADGAGDAPGIGDGHRRSAARSTSTQSNLGSNVERGAGGEPAAQRPQLGGPHPARAGQQAELVDRDAGQRASS